MTWSTWIPRSASSSSTARFERPKRRYQRTASTITSAGKRKPAKVDRGTGAGRERRVLMAGVSLPGLRSERTQLPDRAPGAARRRRPHQMPRGDVASPRSPSGRWWSRSVQPFSQRRSCLEGVQGPPRAQQRLFGGVLRVVKRAQHPVTVHIDLADVGLHERAEARLVASQPARPREARPGRASSRSEQTWPDDSGQLAPWTGRLLAPCRWWRCGLEGLSPTTLTGLCAGARETAVKPG